MLRDFVAADVLVFIVCFLASQDVEMVLVHILWRRKASMR